MLRRETARELLRGRAGLRVVTRSGSFLRLGVQAQVEQAQVVQQSLLFGALRVAGKIVIPKGGTALGNSLDGSVQLMLHLPSSQNPGRGEGEPLREHPSI